jgi:hypothetical protein
VSPFVRSICEKTLALKDAPEEVFTCQTDVTVAVALLIDWAVASNLVASKVLSMLLTGHVGEQGAWSQVRTRLANIKKGLAKISGQYKAKFSQRSVEQRLVSSFWLPLATSYPDVRTHAQQAKIDAAASRGAST